MFFLFPSVASCMSPVLLEKKKSCLHTSIYRQLFWGSGKTPAEDDWTFLHTHCSVQLKCAGIKGCSMHAAWRQCMGKGWLSHIADQQFPAMIHSNLLFIRVLGLWNSDPGQWGPRSQVNINTPRGCREVYRGPVKSEGKPAKWGNSSSALSAKLC